MNYSKPRKLLALYSIDYGYVPTNMAGNKVLHVVSYFPPTDLKVGDCVYLHSSSPDFKMPHDQFFIKDISGPRIILESPTFTGTSHGWHWGYSTREYGAPPGIYRNWIYGSGAPTLFLVY